MSYGTQLIDIGQVYDQAREVYFFEEEVRSTLGPKVAVYTASPIEADTWWRSQDPINETYSMILDVAVADDDCTIIHDQVRDTQQRMLNAGKAGICVLSEILLPESFEQESEPWLEKVQNSLSSFEDPGLADKTHFFKLLKGLSDTLDDTEEFTVDEVESLLVSAEMFHSSVQNTQALVRDGHVSLGDSTPEHFAEIMLIQEKLCNDIYDKVTRFIFLPEADDTETNKRFDELRMLGLKARVFQVANAFSFEETLAPDDEQARIVSDRKMLALEVIIADLSHVFDHAGLSTSTRIKNSQIKGPLHEVIWFLDTCMLKSQYPDKYSGITVMPAFDSSDRPHVGKPANRRGYDYVVNKGSMYDYIQLKSSPQKGKRKVDTKYHPTIIQLEEQNFMDINPKRLRGRIRSYQQVVESGFSVDTEEVVDKYALPTAKLAMKNSYIRNHDRGSQMRKMLMKYRLPGVVENVRLGNMNREQRRAEAKKKRGNK